VIYSKHQVFCNIWLDIFSSPCLKHERFSIFAAVCNFSTWFCSRYSCRHVKDNRETGGKKPVGTKSIWNVCSLVQTSYSVWYRDETEMGWYEVRYAPCLSKVLLRSWFAGQGQGRTRYLNLLICDHYRQDVYFWSYPKENVSSNMVGKSKWHCVTNFLSHNFSSCNIIFEIIDAPLE
jgi:hypothetical protein